jgi:S1-C subfamily serine protease
MLFRKYLTAGLMALPVALAVFFSSAIAIESSLSSLDQAMNRLVDHISKSVVTVNVMTSAQRPIDASGGGSPIVSLLSSGVVIDSLGHILVAAQTVRTSSKISIEYTDMVVDASVVATDYQTGLALLRAEKTVGIPVEIADEYVCNAQMIVAIGSSHGVRACATIGFCAGVRDDGGLRFTLPVVSGSLGGGLFDLKGKLVGVICGSVGQRGEGESGVAVPAYEISNAVSHLLKHGDRKAGFLGVTTMETEIDPPLRTQNTSWLASAVEPAPAAYSHGVVISNMISGSPAVVSGLRQGDVIFRVEKKPISSQADLRNLVRSISPGRWITVDFLRGLTPQSVRIQLAESQLLPWSESQAQSRSSLSQSTRDSLLSEISRLKSSLQEIEARLQVLPK